MREEEYRVDPDPWLAAVLGREVFRLQVCGCHALRILDPESREQSRLRTFLDRSPVFIYAKLSPSSVPAIGAVEELGFRLVDTNLLFEKPVEGGAALKSGCTIRLSEPGDEEAVAAMAEKSFRYSRFHLDRSLEEGLADSVKREWVRNFYRGRRGDAMVVALAGGRVKGFLQLLRAGNDTVTIDLLATDPEWRRRGLGADMLAYVESRYSGVRNIRAGTQLANGPSLHFYQRRGFRLTAAHHVFHYHNGP